MPDHLTKMFSSSPSHNYYACAADLLTTKASKRLQRKTWFAMWSLGLFSCAWSSHMTMFSFSSHKSYVCVAGLLTTKPLTVFLCKLSDHLLCRLLDHLTKSCFSSLPTITCLCWRLTDYNSFQKITKKQCLECGTVSCANCLTPHNNVFLLFPQLLSVLETSRLQRLSKDCKGTFFFLDCDSLDYFLVKTAWQPQFFFSSHNP